MYTNTPLDNHWEGTAPFLIVNPLRKRNWFQANICPRIQPFLLCFGVAANYTAHLVQLLSGEEIFRFSKLFMPIEVAILTSKWGYWGAFLLFCGYAVMSVWYFTIALMNHNTENAWNLEMKNNAADWGVA